MLNLELWKWWSDFRYIINLKTQANYKFLVDTDSKYLYVRNRINSINGIFSFNVISWIPLEDVQTFHSQAMFAAFLKITSYND